MGDYVLESNPALERLIERHHGQGEGASLDDGSRSDGCPRDLAPGASRRTHTHRIARRVFQTRSVVDETTRPAEGAAEDDAAEVARGNAAVVEDDRWAIHETLQPLDEMVLLDFDEEPEVFVEDLTDDDDDYDYDDAEEDEVLDLYEDEDWVTEEEGAEDEGVFDEDRWIIDEDEEELLVEGPEAGGESSDRNWIFEAFEAWKRELVEDDVVIVP